MQSVDVVRLTLRECVSQQLLIHLVFVWSSCIDLFDNQRLLYNGDLGANFLTMEASLELLDTTCVSKRSTDGYLNIGTVNTSLELFDILTLDLLSLSSKDPSSRSVFSLLEFFKLVLCLLSEVEKVDSVSSENTLIITGLDSRHRSEPSSNF